MFPVDPITLKRIGPDIKIDLNAPDLLSVCCGALPLGETHGSTAPKDSPYWYPEIMGICSDCKDHASFEPEEEEAKS